MLRGGARDQYLGHHGFCFISWRLVDGWILYLRCWFSVTQTLTWIYVCRSVTYISWSSDFAVQLEDYMMDNYHDWDIGAEIDLIKYMWVSDLHFMVQWFCLLSWRLFDGLMLYWRYWFSMTQTLTWNFICRSVTYISWSSDFTLYFEEYLMDKCHNWNIGSMWCKDFPHKIYMRQWTTFHGPVILSYILTFWWRMLYWRYWFSATLSLTYK